MTITRWAYDRITTGNATSDVIVERWAINDEINAEDEVRSLTLRRAPEQLLVFRSPMRVAG